MSLNFTQKADILAKLDSGVSGNHLAKKYGVAKSTISRIKKYRSDIENAIANPDEYQDNLSLAEGSRSVVEQALYEWVLKQYNAVVNEKSLRNKAREIHQHIYHKDDFDPSEKWLWNFKRRYILHPEFQSLSNTPINIDNKYLNQFEFTPSTYDTDEKSVQSNEKMTHFNSSSSERTQSDDEQSFSNRSVETDQSNSENHEESGGEESESSDGSKLNKIVNRKRSIMTDSSNSESSSETESMNGSTTESDRDSHTDESYDDDDDGEDPNKLCDRLRTLLFTSSNASNFNSNTEIIRIISKLRDNGVI